MTDSEAEAPTLWPHDAKSRFMEKTLMEKTEGKRRSRQQRMRWLNSISNSMYRNLSRRQWRTEDGMLQFMGSQRVRQDAAT